MAGNGIFVLGGPETQLHAILWAIHDGKNRGRSEGEEYFGGLPGTVGERCAVLSYRCKALALTEPERGVGH